MREDISNDLYEQWVSSRRLHDMQQETARLRKAYKRALTITFVEFVVLLMFIVTVAYLVRNV